MITHLGTLSLDGRVLIEAAPCQCRISEPRDQSIDLGPFQGRWCVQFEGLDPPLRLDFDECLRMLFAVRVEEWQAIDGVRVLQRIYEGSAIWTDGRPVMELEGPSFRRWLDLVFEGTGSPYPIDHLATPE